MTRVLAYLGAGSIAVAALASSAPLLSASRYEAPPSFSAAKLLPPDLLQSPYHQVEGPVVIDGYLGRYQLRTQYGTFTVLGTDLLRLRVREAAATAHIAQIDGAETLVTSAGRTALKPLATARDLVTAPGKTVGDTVRGVGGWFGRIDASMAATDPNREGTIASLAGGSKARRKLAYDFGIDPYTTFPPLNAELTRVASASAIGETATAAGLAFVTGGAGIAISVGSTSQTLRQVLRDKTAAELERMGRQELAMMGVSEGAISAFYGTAALTPTDKAVIVTALKSLGGASGQEVFVLRAANATTYAEGFFYRRQAELIAAYHRRIAPIRSFIPLDGVPLVQTSKGVAAIAPIDYLYWSEPLEALVSAPGAPKGEAWISGSASRIATANLARRGWKVVPNAEPRLIPR